MLTFATQADINQKAVRNKYYLLLKNLLRSVI